MIGQKGLQNWGVIKVNQTEIPVEIVLTIAHAIAPETSQGYIKLFSYLTNKSPMIVIIQLHRL